MGRLQSDRAVRARGVKKKTSARGTQYGGKRHKPDLVARRQQARNQDGRIRTAKEQVEEERKALEARIAHEQAHPTVGRVTGAQWRAKPEPVVETSWTETLEKPTKPRIKLPTEDAEGNGKWTLGQARSMLRHGYHVYKVQRVTGYGAKWFDDMLVDADGFGLPL